jgi:hypothetical protein
LVPAPGPHGQAPAGPGSPDHRPDIAAALRPLLIDVGIPIGTYYLLRNAFGVSLWLSLALSSIGPAVRAVAGLVAERKLNVLAMLMLAVNLAGIAARCFARTRLDPMTSSLDRRPGVKLACRDKRT